MKPNFKQRFLFLMALLGMLIPSLLLLPAGVRAATITDSPNAAAVYTTTTVKITGTGTTWKSGTAPSFSITGVSGVTLGTPVVISDTLCYLPLTTGPNTTDVSTSPATLHENTSGASCPFAVGGLPPASPALAAADSLTFSGTVAAGGAGSTAVGATDASGSTWSVVSGKLTGVKSTGNLTGNPLYLAGAGLSVNQEVSATFVGSDNAGGFVTLLLRSPGGTAAAGLAAVLNVPASTGSSFGLLLYYQQPGGSFTSLATVFNSGALYSTATDTYRLDGYATGTAPSVFRFKLVDVTTSTTLFDNTGGAGNSNTGTFDQAGYCGLTNRSGTSKFTALSSQSAPYAFGLPGVTRTTFGASSVGLSASPPTGTTGALTYQWYRSATPGFTPGAGNVLSGQTATTLTDTPPDASVYYYKVVATDSAATPNVIMSVDCPASLWSTPLVVGWMGDSLEVRTPGVTGDATANEDFPTTTARHLGQLSNGLHSVTTVNQGVPSTASAHWTPTSTLLGSAATNPYNTAVAAFQAAGVTVVCVQLGVNDAGQGITSSAYQSNMTTIVNALVAAGYTVFVGFPPYNFQTTPLSNNTGLLLQYQTVLSSLVDNVHVFAGPTLIEPYFAQHAAEYADGLHPNAAGIKTYAWYWATAMAKVLYPAAPALNAFQPRRGR